MPRSARDSEDDFEPKSATGRMQTRMLTVNSPLRRSSRIKQYKHSPGSESDSSSVSNSQTTRSTKTRAEIIDSTGSDTMKKLRTRNPSISSDVSDVEVLLTPKKRITRQSSAALLPGTPTRVNTRAINKHFVRAASEVQSPMPATKTTRKTRASSVGPESLSNENKNQSDSSIKTRKRASMLPSSSLAKEPTELSDRIPYVRLDATIVEADEIITSGNSDSSPDKAHLPQKIKKHQTIDKDEVEESDNDEKADVSIDSSKDMDKVKTAVEDMDKVKNAENFLAKKYNLENAPPSDNDAINEVSCSRNSSSRRNSLKEDKTKIDEETLSDENLLVDIGKSSKENMSKNLLDISNEEQKSDKENETLNINSEMSVKKDIPNVTSSIKSLTSPFMSKLLDESENKSVKKDLSKRRRSRESTEIAIKHHDLSKEVADSFQEKMDISIESLNSTDKTVLSRHDNTLLVDKVTNKDETSVENLNISTNEDATEITSESSKIDEKECIIINNQSSENIDKIDKTSCSFTSLTKSTQMENTDDSIICIEDNNEVKLILDERSREDNEISSNIVHSKPDQSVELEVSSPINESSNDQDNSTVTQDKVINNSDFTEQEQENLSKHATESTSEFSNTILETNNSAHNDSNDTVIQDDQSSDIMETSKISIINKSPEKTDAKDILPEKIVNLKRKSTDVLDDVQKEKDSSQMEISQKDQENTEIADDVSDIEGIDLFQDIPADKWKEKKNVKIDSVQSTSQSVEEMKNDIESECDLLLVDKEAWLAAQDIKASKETESFEYDSDDTVLLKSQLDASQANIEKMDIIDEELQTDIDNEENEDQVKKRKSRTKRRLTSEIDQDSSRYPPEDEDNLVTVDTSFNKSKTALNRTNDRSISRLNTSEQLARRRSSKASNESDKEEIKDDTKKLNRSSLISKKNTPLRKSIRKRTSLNKSLKDTPMQNVSANNSQMNDSEEEFDNTDAHTVKKLHKKKHSLNKSRNEDTDDASKFGNKNVSIEDKKDENASLGDSSMAQKSKSDTKATIHLKDNESDNSDINITAMNFECKTYSMIANAGSMNNSYQDEYEIPSYLFMKTNNDHDATSSSDTASSTDINVDIHNEYNLDGVEQEFSDKDVPADECRTSEAEFSDSDDNGSDLADFIVDDDVEDGEEEADDEEGTHEMIYDENVEDNDAAFEEVENEEDKQEYIETELVNVEDKNEENDEEERDIQEKNYSADKEEDNENKFAEIEVISSYASTSDKLSKIKKKKKKSLTKENDTILLDASNLTSSLIKNRRKSNPLRSSKNRAELESNEQLNECEFLKKLPESRELMKFSTPNNSCKKLESDEIFERTSENKDINSDDTIKATQNTSNKKKSKKSPILKEDINLEKFSHVNKKKISNSNFSPDLLKLLQNLSESTCFSTSAKREIRKTMFVNAESPTIKHLRKDKLNESAPALKLNTETNSLSAKELFTKRKDAQVKIKEKSNKDQISDLIILSNDDAIQKCSQKKQKKRKKRDTSKENITGKALSEDEIELDVPKRKKLKLTQLTTVDNNIREDACQISGKRKKKKQSRENIMIDEVLSEDAIELMISKEKKPIKLTQLTIVDNDIREDASSEKKKKKKKQDTSKENIIDEVLSERAVQLKISKKKKPVKLTQSIIDEDAISEKKKKKKQVASKKNIVDKAVSDVELQIPERTKRVKLIQLPIVEDNTREDTCYINEKRKKKKNKQETQNKNITKNLPEDVVDLKMPKKMKRDKLSQSTIIEDNICVSDAYQINEKEKKRKKRETPKENIKKALSEDAVELKIPKKMKRAKLSQSTIIDDNICVSDAYQINEKEKKKKKGKTLKENIEKALSEDAVELKISKKKKRINFNQLAVQDDICEDAYRINEKETKKKKKQINVNEEDENVNEDNVLRKNIRENKTELAQQKKKKRSVRRLKLDSPTDKYMLRKKTKQQETMGSPETLRTKKKKTTLPVQIPVSKLKSDKNLLSYELLRKTASDSKNVYVTKKLNTPTKKCIPKELKPKRKRDRIEDIENVNVSTKKSKKEIKEVTEFLPSSSGLKRLPNDVIENLTDVPMRTKKRRKMSRNEKQIVSSVKTSKSKITDCDNSVTSNSSGATQFHVVNLQNIKKPKGTAVAASFRKRMLARNNREQISANMICRDKVNFIE